jgi:hypothetical protein
MPLAMIKPFKILETRTEQDGSTGVVFEVFKSQVSENGTSGGRLMRTYISVPEGEDIDQYVFNFLDRGGWV